MHALPASIAWEGERAPSAAEAQEFCRRLASRHEENFAVLSRLLRRDVAEEFAAIYAFCRGADDLGDEMGTPERAKEGLAWWRSQLDGCYAGAPRHPVFVALAPVIERHSLPREPFEALIGAFELDQVKVRYETWEELLGYCRGSADPVGRLVLMVLDEARDEEAFRLSDSICTGLQLANHWQDVRRDLLERGRIYIPRECWKGEAFEESLASTAREARAPAGSFLASFRETIRSCVERTWPHFDAAPALLARLRPDSRAPVWLFAQGGMAILRKIEAHGFATALARPAPSAFRKGMLVAEAWIRSRTWGFGS